MEPIKIDLPDVANEALKPLAQSIGNTLSSIWDVCFGWIDMSAEKVQYKRQLALKSFKDDLEHEISKIPAENLCEPELSVVGPALEASKYFFEEEALRSMFAKLIANSMNKSTADYVHTAFVDLIKQMSSVDAYFMSTFKPNNVYPCVRFSLQEDNKKSFSVKMPLVYFDPQRDDTVFQESAVSLFNLQRLGLINISLTEWLNDDLYYEKYKNWSGAFLYESHIDSNGVEHSEVSKPLKMDKGNISLTPLGESFIKVCL